MSLAAAGLKSDLAALGRAEDDTIDLGEAALALAALEQPQSDRQRYRGRMAEMTAALAALAHDAETAAHRAQALATVLVGRFRLGGDDDDDNPHYANLMQLLDRRRGPAPILALLWLHIARRQGWAAEALGFPGDPLLRLAGADGERVILDPFADGALLATHALRDRLKLAAGNAAELEPGHYAALGNRAVLLRLLTAVKLRHLRHALLTGAAAAVEAMLLIAPMEFGLWREAGLIHLRQGNLPRAVAALEEFLARAPNSTIRHRTSVLLQDLRAKLE